MLSLPLVTNGVATAIGRFTAEFAFELQIFSNPFLLKGTCCFECLLHSGSHQVLKNCEKDVGIFLKQHSGLVEL